MLSPKDVKISTHICPVCGVISTTVLECNRPTIKCPMKPLPIKMKWFTPKKASGKYNETWLLISSSGNCHRHTL